MNSQNTPIHIGLWHRDFWLMVIANLLITSSAYMFIPTMPQWLMETQALSACETGLVMGIFGVGLFVFGPFVSFLVQHYRRNMVCVRALTAVIIILLTLYYLEEQCSQFVDISLLLLLRFALGACYGLSLMILTSTLIIDTCESFQRTEANYASAWFSRLALALGPMVGLLICHIAGFGDVLLMAAGSSGLAVVLVMLVNFPFRAPVDEVAVLSLDRFFLSNSSPLFQNLLLVIMAVGIVLSIPLTVQFYAMMMVGFLMVLLCGRFVFRQAGFKTEVVSGILLLSCAILMLATRTQQVVDYVAPLFIGLGLGIIGSRFLLFFIKLSRHCQRGTSQSTFFLAWEGGLALGVGMGIALFNGYAEYGLRTALALVVVALVMYQYTHQWFIRNKNR